MDEEEKIIAADNDNNRQDEVFKEELIKEVGITVSQIDNNLRLKQNIPDNVNGLFITKVEQNTEAETKGIRAGDVIQEINQSPLKTINDMRKILRSTKSSKKGILLLINRQGNINFFALKVN